MVNLYTAHIQNSLGRSKRIKPDKFIYNLRNYEWIQGVELKKKISTFYDDEPYINVKTTISKDSLFNNPGILYTYKKRISFDPIENPQDYDLSSFKVDVVKNDKSFCFDRDQLDCYGHAQHKLRVITYYYAKKYVSDYLMPQSGIFIEKHDFIQAITPLQETCNGYVIIGRIKGSILQLLAIAIPFGYTLLVQPQAIHGDSTLVGLYSMAMTGNHNAMATADTVFLKSSKNINTTLRFKNDNRKDVQTPVLAVTSNVMSNDNLNILDFQLKKDISSNTNNSSLHRPVIFTPTAKLGYPKTIGDKLPS